MKLHWQEFGAGEPTIVLLPTWSIAHSRSLEVPGAVPVPPPPGRDVRRTGLWPIGPAHRAGGVQLPRVRRRHARRARRHGHRPGGARRPLHGRGVGAAGRRRSPGTGARGRLSRPGGPAGAHAGRRAHRVPVRRTAGLHGGVGEVQPPLLDGGRLRGLPRVLLRPVLSPSRTRPSRSTTSSAGGSTPNRADPGRHATKASMPAAGGHVSRRSASGSQHPCSSSTATRTTIGRTPPDTRWPSSPAARSSPSPAAVTRCTARDPVIVNRTIKRFVDRVGR